jgi:hypothetical protein
MEFLPASTPIAFLDATGNKMVIEKTHPGTRIVEIQAKRNAIIFQIMDSALSAHRLNENNAHLQERIAELIQRIIQHYGPDGMMIGPKGFISEMTGNGYVPESVVTAHFNALRGLNSGEHQHWGLMLGRNEPDAYSIESQARAWFADEEAFKPGTAFRGPQMLTAKDGKAVSVTTTQFADPYCQAMMEQAREAESIQAIDRLRLVHSDKPKIVFILSNQPLPGITPDHLVKLDELLLPGRIATVMLRDQAITGPATMAQRHPDLFKDQQAAKDALSEASMGDFPNRIYIGKSPIEAGTPAPPARAENRYRTARQKGGKNRKAWLYPSAEPAAILSAIHSEPITLIDVPKHEAKTESVSAPAPGNLEAALGQPFVATPEADPHHEPDPPPIAPPAPTARIGEVAMNKPGNIEFVLGCAFDPDWEQPEITRSVSWQVTMLDGRTCTLRTPENPDIIEARGIAQRMIPTTHHIAPVRAWAG